MTNKVGYRKRPCACHAKHMGHWFDKTLVCMCGVSFQGHQCDPKKCSGAKVRRAIFDSGGARPKKRAIKKECKRGHSKTNEHGYIDKKKGYWICSTCKRLTRTRSVKDRAALEKAQERRQLASSGG